MNILNISFIAANPPRCGGHLRIANYNLALSRQEGVQVEQYSYRPAYFNKHKMLSFNNGRYKEFFRHSLLYSLTNLLVLFILGIKSWYFIIHDVFKFVIPDKTIRERFQWADVIQVECPFLIPWISRYTSKPIICIAHNVEYHLALSILEHKNPNLPQFIKKWIGKKMFYIEKRGIELSDYFFCVSREDKKEMLDLYAPPEEKLVIVCNGVNQEDYTPVTEELRIESRKKMGLEGYTHIFLFSGSFHPPNVAAAEFIRTRLAPRFPEALFLIVGSVYPKPQKETNVHITGPVTSEELKEYFKTPDMALNPMPYGSGSNIKMFEYMALHLPVITTENGIQGLAEETMDAVIIASLEEFGDALKQYIHSPHEHISWKKKIEKAAPYHYYSRITKEAIKYYKELAEKTNQIAYGLQQAVEQ